MNKTKKYKYSTCWQSSETFLSINFLAFNSTFLSFFLLFNERSLGILICCFFFLFYLKVLFSFIFLYISFFYKFCVTFTSYFLYNIHFCFLIVTPLDAFSFVSLYPSYKLSVTVVDNTVFLLDFFFWTLEKNEKKKHI